jgi:hypothetical protein
MRQNSFKNFYMRRINLLLWPSIDDVLAINNEQFKRYVEFIYAGEVEIKDIKETSTFASYLDTGCK